MGNTPTATIAGPVLTAISDLIRPPCRSVYAIGRELVEVAGTADVVSDPTLSCASVTSVDDLGRSHPVVLAMPTGVVSLKFLHTRRALPLGSAAEANAVGLRRPPATAGASPVRGASPARAPLRRFVSEVKGLPGHHTGSRMILSGFPGFVRVGLAGDLSGKRRATSSRLRNLISCRGRRSYGSW